MLLASLTASASGKETAYERIMRTKEIRCGYWSYEPFISVDAASGKVGGIVYDYLNEVAGRSGFEIDWAGEVNFDQIVSSLESGRYDAFCLPATPGPEFEKVLDFPARMGALPYYLYVRAGSDPDEDQLKSAKFVTADGYALSEITLNSFPDAKILSLPQNSSAAEMYDQLRYGKADAHVNEHISASNYMKNNPGVIERFSDIPLIAMRMFLVSRKGDKEIYALLDGMFDTYIPENLSLMREILARHELPEGILLLGEECKNPHHNEKQWKICDK